jgi:hypothetical protein
MRLLLMQLFQTPIIAKAESDALPAAPRILQKRRATLLQNTPDKVKGWGQTPEEVKGPLFWALCALF